MPGAVSLINVKLMNIFARFVKLLKFHKLTVNQGKINGSYTQTEE